MFSPNACWINTAPENMSTCRSTPGESRTCLQTVCVWGGGGGTHGNLCENVKKEGDDGEVDVDPGSSEALLQVLGHGDHLKAAAAFQPSHMKAEPEVEDLLEGGGLTPAVR